MFGLRVEEVGLLAQMIKSKDEEQDKGQMGDPGKPEEINILGIRYTVEYKDNPSEVDGRKRESLWGSIDFWERKIRVYDNKRSTEDRWHTIIHEVLHGIANALNMDKLNDDEDTVDMLALALVDTMFRNEWIREEIASEDG